MPASFSHPLPSLYCVPVHKVACQKLIRGLCEFIPQAQECQIGTTRVLYRSPVHRVLELFKCLALERTVLFLQVSQGYKGNASPR